MTPLFLDTAYVYALLNTRDEWHERAKNWQAFLAARRQTLITTEFILVEIGDGLANLRFRKQAILRLHSKPPRIKIPAHLPRQRLVLPEQPPRGQSTPKHPALRLVLYGFEPIRRARPRFERLLVRRVDSLPQRGTQLRRHVLHPH